MTAEKTPTPMRKSVYWSAFAACQILGFAMFLFVNVHNNIAPLFAAAILLLPAGILAMFFPGLPVVATVSAIVLLNFAAWYAFQRWGGAEIGSEK